jgi:cation:H+ antiporter
MVYLELVAGFLLLVAGGDALVRGAVAIARRIGVSPLLIGLTLVGFGTSTPELLTSVQAALAGSPGIAFGNVVGSNTANILLILGIAALISPLRTSPHAFRRDGTVVLLSALACVGVVLFGRLDRPIGVVLVMLLIAYIVYTYRRERVVHDASAAMHEAEASAAEPAPTRLWVATLFTLGGMALTVLGARFLVDGAIELARAAGISETIVGLTIVAVGTSLPELVTSVMAAVRRQSDVAFGNIVGSNIYNVLGILGVTAIVRPIPVPPEIARLDIWVMLAATVLLLVFSVTGWRVTRTEGGVLLAAYIAYVGYLVSLVAAP